MRLRRDHLGITGVSYEQVLPRVLPERLGPPARDCPRSAQLTGNRVPGPVAEGDDRVGVLRCALFTRTDATLVRQYLDGHMEMPGTGQQVFQLRVHDVRAADPLKKYGLRHRGPQLQRVVGGRFSCRDPGRRTSRRWLFGRAGASGSGVRSERSAACEVSGMPLEKSLRAGFVGADPALLRPSAHTAEALFRKGANQADCCCSQTDCCVR